MYRVFLERAAEKDLARLSSEVHDRVISAIRGLASEAIFACTKRLVSNGQPWLQ